MHHGLIVQLCHSWLSVETATQISHRRHPTGTIQLQKVKKKKREKKEGKSERHYRLVMTSENKLCFGDNPEVLKIWFGDNKF